MLAEELHGALLVDDSAARQEASRRNIPVLGSLSILRAAKRYGLIPEVTSHLNALRATGFRIRDELSTRLLREMGEAYVSLLSLEGDLQCRRTRRSIVPPSIPC